jgi:glycosyltransferase involved in cell wall biosynthesis
MAESSNHSSTHIIIDLRCLQDPAYATRGIGQHARGIIARRPAGIGRLTGLIDPHLPLPEAEILDQFDAVQPNGVFTELPAGTTFLNPSPMTADPLFTAPLLLAPIRRIAIVYDFIPFDGANHYLALKRLRIDYAARLAWLAKYDLFLPISDATRRRMEELLGARHSIVTGVPLPDWIGPALDAEPLHILAVAGDDFRKNPEVVIRAHAASQVLQARRIKLIVTGSYPADVKARFRGIAASAGGDDALLSMPGHVDLQTLRGYYQQAFCVVTPSRAEGFSLPVVEAMAAGVPSIASDIPPHATLVTDAALRFAPDDCPALAAILARIVASSGYRAGIVAAQADIWPLYDAKTVSAKVWVSVRG